MANVRRKKIDKTEKGFIDFTLIFVVLLLVAIGLVIIYSSSFYYATIQKGDGMYFFKRQAIFAFGGLIIMIIVSIMPWKFFKKITPIFYALMILVQLLVFVVGRDVNGSKRWIYIKGIGIQPSEVSKIALILFVALFAAVMAKNIKTFKSLGKAFIICIFMIGPVAASDLSTAIIMAGCSFVILFVACNNTKHFVGILIAAAAVVFGFIKLFPYRAARVEGWLHVETSKNAFQIRQGLYAVGSGGLFGKGLGQSIQKFNLPEPHTDMIYSILCEELGIIFGIAVIVLFVILIWRCLVIANNARSMFESLTVVGIMTHIGLQAFVNIAVATNTIPNTGVTLPFISYGGTSLVFLLAEIGIVLNVARRIRLNAVQADERVVEE